MPVSDDMGSTLLRILAFRSAVFRTHLDRIKMAAPETCGVAIEVPLI